VDGTGSGSCPVAVSILAVFTRRAELQELTVSLERRDDRRCGVVPCSDISYVFIDRRCIEVTWREAVCCPSDGLHYQQRNSFCITITCCSSGKGF
jgi:hypothetical protein